MEKRETFWTLNTPFALLIAGCCIVASYLTLRQSGHLYGNPVLEKIITFLYVIGLFMQIRRYRESKKQEGYISYGSGFVTGLYISGLSGLIYGIYTIILYSVYPEALANYLTALENFFRENYSGSPLAEEMLKMVKTFTTPFSIGFSEFFSKSLLGIIYTLPIAAILRKIKPRGAQYE